jgi:polyhydroxyalkanoate synthesis regulator phasin
MSTQQTKADDKTANKKESAVEIAIKKLVEALVQRGALKAHQAEEVLKELK